MSHASFFHHSRDRVRSGFAEVAGKWSWYLALGVFLVVMGCIATGMAATTTILSTVLLGWILLVAGAGLAILSFLTGRWSGFLLTMAAGILSIVAGTEILNYPASGAAVITLIIGTMLAVAGIFRSIGAASMQFPNWGWSLLSGIVTFLFGAALIKNWQGSGLWFLGLAVGVDLIFHGISWITFSFGIHNIASALGITETDRRVA
jgi:uncharacterized membrane protein HdeD (DUF308 family)